MRNGKVVDKLKDNDKFYTGRSNFCLDRLFEQKMEDNEVEERFVKITVTPYNGDPGTFHEFMAEYYQLSEAYGISEKAMIKRLPIYI